MKNISSKFNRFRWIPFQNICSYQRFPKFLNFRQSKAFLKIRNYFIVVYREFVQIFYNFGFFFYLETTTAKHYTKNILYFIKELCMLLIICNVDLTGIFLKCFFFQKKMKYIVWLIYILCFSNSSSRHPRIGNFWSTHIFIIPQSSSNFKKTK